MKSFEFLVGVLIEVLAVVLECRHAEHAQPARQPAVEQILLRVRQRDAGVLIGDLRQSPEIAVGEFKLALRRGDGKRRWRGRLDVPRALEFFPVRFLSECCRRHSLLAAGVAYCGLTFVFRDGRRRRLGRDGLPPSRLRRYRGS